MLGYSLVVRMTWPIALSFEFITWPSNFIIINKRTALEGIVRSAVAMTLIQQMK